MKEKTIGQYKTYVLESDDLVVVMGDVEKHADMLAEHGFEQHSETKEWLGRGHDLYALQPDLIFSLFSGRDSGTAQLSAQATDGKDFYQIDSLPVVEQDPQGKDRITEIHALDMETRTYIDEGVSNFRVG